MTRTKIMELAKREQIKFTAAEKIREILDAARTEYGASDWDNEDIESTVSELVFEPDPE